MVIVQPADWQESDSNFKYVVDVFGRNQDFEVVKVRLTGFYPYFYLLAKDGETADQLYSAIEVSSGKKLIGMKITQEQKLDAMSGFCGLKPIKVWKIACPALWMFKTVIKTLKHGFCLKGRHVYPSDIYESNLPPFIRLFHELDIAPASPFEFEADEESPEDGIIVDKCYTVQYKNVTPKPSASIPLYVLGFDIEVYSDSGLFPVAKNDLDEITQIGMSFRWSDNLLKSERRCVIVNGEVSKPEDSDVEYISCKNEKQLLATFEKLIQEENPDAICGYNTFGFDDAYIADRASKNSIRLQLGRTEGSSAWKYESACVPTEHKKFELASGTFDVRFFEMPGRLPIDLLLSVRREQNLDSYKLDNVASTFLRDKVTKVERLDDQHVKIYTKNTRGLFNGNLVRFDIVGNTINPYQEGRKFRIQDVEAKSFVVVTEDVILNDINISNLEWSFTKDDVSFKDMLDAHHGTPDQRANIAKYCLQDCDLVLTLMAKLDTLVNARGMADVCRVPIQFIFLRGQGIKIYSAVIYNASKRNQIIVTQEGFEGDTSYEGAIVLPPKIGMYLNQPIPVLDFNSLYPSNMIAYNLSPDTLVYVKTFDANGKKVSQQGPDGKEFKDAGYVIDEIGYDVDNGRVICGFVQPRAEDPRTIGLLPLTLDILLKMRKETRKLMEKTEDEAQKSVLNGLQLAYKVVANSVYGQCGSKTSPIRSLEVAACTTAAGRDRIQFAKKIVETEFGAEVIYGDTDSIFVKFPTQDLEQSMKLGQQAAERITSAINRRPYKIEYEKTFYPFILFCRKRYVGMMYEDDPTKCKRKSMGIALKRRDNAPIVKDVFGGALDILMEKRDIKSAQKFVQDMLVQVMQNKMPLDKYIITKQLRDDYKNPDQIAHRVLANRMIERDPGNAPQVGDRLPYIYVANRRDEKKQGDKIEHVDYVKQHNLKPDVEFYITNQIQNPVAQLFALAIDQLDGYKSKVNYDKMLKEYLDSGLDEEDATLAVLKQKEKELDSILFTSASYLTKHKRGPMDAFLGRK